MSLIKIRKILQISSLLIAVALVLLITIMLLLFPSDKTYVLQISIAPENISRIEIKKDQKIVIYKKREPIYYDISGSVDNPNMSSILVSLRRDKKDFDPPDTFKVLNSTFLGAIELISSGSTVTGNKIFTYDITSGDDHSRLSFGEIQLLVKEIITRNNPWVVRIIGAIGLLASILQIVQYVMEKNKTRTA